jgi:hypothetical protein
VAHVSNSREEESSAHLRFRLQRTLLIAIDKRFHGFLFIIRYPIVYLLPYPRVSQDVLNLVRFSVDASTEQGKRSRLWHPQTRPCKTIAIISQLISRCEDRRKREQESNSDAWWRRSPRSTKLGRKQLSQLPQYRLYQEGNSTKTTHCELNIASSLSKTQYS